jgi:hypothetical protein
MILESEPGSLKFPVTVALARRAAPSPSGTVHAPAFRTGLRLPARGFFVQPPRVGAGPFPRFRPREDGDLPDGRAGAAHRPGAFTIALFVHYMDHGPLPAARSAFGQAGRQSEKECFRPKVKPVPLAASGPDDLLRFWPVSKALNTPRNNGPELLGEQTTTADGGGGPNPA